MHEVPSGAKTFGGEHEQMKLPKVLVHCSSQPPLPGNIHSSTSKAQFGPWRPGWHLQRRPKPPGLHKEPDDPHS